MSTPVIDLGALISAVVNSLTAIVTAFSDAISTYAPVIAQVLIVLGVVGGIGYAIYRWGARLPFFGWLMRFFR